MIEETTQRGYYIDHSFVFGWGQSNLLVVILQMYQYGCLQKERGNLTIQVLEYQKNIRMNISTFLAEGNCLPSFALFGHSQLITHIPIARQNQKGSIRRKIMNPSHLNQGPLAQSLSQSLFNLLRELNMEPENPFEVKIAFLRKMLQAVVSAAGKATQSYHNIIYLTLKYLAYLVTQHAKLALTSLEDCIGLNSWLLDIHKIYYNINPNKNYSPSEETMLLFLLKEGKYGQMTVILQRMYQRVKLQDPNMAAKIDDAYRLVTYKVHEQVENITNEKLMNSIKMTRQSLIRNLSKKYMIAELPKSRKQKMDSIEFIIQVLLGRKESVQTFAADSWPLFVMLQAEKNQLKDQNIKGQLRQHTLDFIKKHSKNAIIEIKQSDFLVHLLFQPDLHTIYQSLYAIVPPFYCHFIAYLFDLISPDCRPGILIEDYFQDMARNLLYHASQISFQCLTFNIALLQEAAAIQRLNQMYQPLLNHHLAVVHIEDKAELIEFLRKVQILESMGLETCALNQLNILLTQLLGNGIISRELLLIYAYCCVISQFYSTQTYNYQELMAYNLQKVYSSCEFNVGFLTDYSILQVQLIQQNRIPFHNALDEIEGLFVKFELFRELAESIQKPNYAMFNHLINITQRSLNLLLLIQQTLKYNLKGLAESYCQYIQSPERSFVKLVRSTVMYYPQRSEKEKQVLLRIDKMIKQFIR